MLIVNCSRGINRTSSLVTLLDSFQTHFLTALYLVMGGSLLYFLGLALYQDFDSNFVRDEDFLLYVLVQWIGCAISTLNIVSSSTLMH